MKKIIRLENIDCANCAAKLERAISKIDGVNEAVINFMAMKLSLDVKDEEYENVIVEIKKVAAKVEPDCIFKGI